MKTISTIAGAGAAIALGVLFTSCGTNSAPGGGVSSIRAGGALSEGKRLYLTRCTACHAPEPVSKYSADEWRSLMPEMAEDAKLSPAQERAVLQYVLGGSGLLS